MKETTSVAQDTPAHADWRTAGLSYFAYNFFLRDKFGERVQHVSLNAQFTCPNVDGTVTTGGCVYCNNRSFSPSRRMPRGTMLAQLDEGMTRIKKRYKADKFLAYFQPATNTYAPVERLRPLYEEALSHEKVVGLVIGTRPDCVPDDVLDLIDELAEDRYVSLEYGIESTHDRSLEWMNRGHKFDAFVDAMDRSRGRNFKIGCHLIVGVPNESRADIIASTQAIIDAGVQSVKFHNLYAVKNTPLGEWVKNGEITLMERDEYISILVDCLEILPSNMIVERISGEAPPPYLIGPAWCLDKPGIRTALEAEIARRDTWQGKKHQPTVR